MTDPDNLPIGDDQLDTGDLVGQGPDAEHDPVPDPPAEGSEDDVAPYGHATPVAELDDFEEAP